MTNKTIQVIFKERKEVQTGENRSGTWVLYKYITEDDSEYTSFDGTYALDAPLEIEYKEVERSGRDNRVFINKRIIGLVGGDTKKEYNQGEEMLNILKSLETKMDSVLRGLKTINEKIK